MPQVLTSLNAVTADATGSVLAFNATRLHYGMQYMITMSGGGPITLFLEGSLDGTNFVIIQTITVGASASALTATSSNPCLYIRARVAGMPAGATVTAILVVSDQ